jgi:hypothetical protein
MRPVETGVIVSPTGDEAIRPAGLRLGTGPEVIPAPVGWLARLWLAAEGDGVSLTGALSPVLRT